MSRYPHPIIAREGWPYIAIAVVVALAVALLAGWLWSLPFWLIALFVLQFFRDPPREVPEGEGLVVSPADGRLISIETVRDPFADREALRLSVFMNVFNVHSNRAPIDGRIEQINYFPGLFLNADLPKASEGNERNALHIRAANGALVTCVQVAGLVARRILCYVHAGDTLSRGQRFGFIRFGSRVDVYLPPDSRPLVGVGEKVQATVTVLAELGSGQAGARPVHAPERADIAAAESGLPAGAPVSRR
jgi:phosphatidylserine decarboxylase